mmetsp:Transcript_89797/g.187672  ORF Transcript_89797/g.187672 Transcript_89797/m.187672 type:complete len:632 (-) Transcript_89797:33-1928(-)
MEVEKAEKNKNTDDTTTEASASNKASKETDVEEGCCSLHVSSKDFTRCPQEKVQSWLAKTSGVGIRKCFKLKQWNYAFVTVRAEEADTFRDKVHGAAYRQTPTVVKDGHARDANSRRPKGDEEPNGKRRKVMKDFPTGYVPTLKDIKDKEKSHKGAGVEKSVKQKSSPLFEYSYADQLGMKETYVKTAVRTFTKQAKAKSEEHGSELEWTTPEWSLRTKSPVGCGCPCDPIIGTPESSLRGYRNKCEFTIGYNSSAEVEVGFVLKIESDMNQVIDSPEEIPHVPEVMKKICRIMKEVVKASSFPIFDRRRGVKTGVWRTVMCRQSANGNMSVMVQIAPLEEDKRAELTGLLVKALTSDDAEDLKITSVHLQLNDGVSDAAQPGAPLIHIHGDERMIMPLMGLNFEIGPLSFFQTNIVTCALLYERALSWLCPDPKALVLDVCCGVGTIGLAVANKCKKVVGLELVPEAVESAKHNAAINGIKNAEYHAGKAEETLPSLLPKELAELGEDCEVCAIVDPPRPGLHKDVLTALRCCDQLSRIVYISCNPDSLVEDVVKLTSMTHDDQDPFVPVRAVAVDMFPHTVHVEMVLLLERKSRAPVPPPLPPKEQQAEGSAKKQESAAEASEKTAAAP